MNENEFDWQIAEKIAHVSYEYEPADWHNLQQQLAAARRKRRTMVFAYVLPGIAASVAFLLIFITPLFTKKETTISLHKLKTPVPQIVLSSTLPATVSPVKTAPVNIIHAQQSAIKQKTTVLASSGAYNLIKSVCTSNSPGINKSFDYTKSSDKPTITTPTQSTVDTAIVILKKSSILYAPSPQVELKNDRKQKSIAISAVGGVNYGTLNTGYTFGSIVSKKLSSKFGIEVAFAYIGNSATTQDIIIPPPGNAIQPVKKINVISPLDYLQCSPVAGYNLTNKITLSAGADIQRLLQGYNVTILYNDNLKTVPVLDLGALAKADYNISLRLKAGISYRIGFNNILAPDKNYIDRDYMQVQLKYRFTGGKKER